MPNVKMLISMGAANFSYAPGDLVFVTNEVAEAWIGVGYAEAHEEQPIKVADLSKDSYIPSPLEVFSDLKADEQKAFLKQLGVEGDDGNEEKRIALYTAYLEKEQSEGGAADGSQSDNATGDGADSTGTGEGTPAN